MNKRLHITKLQLIVITVVLIGVGGVAMWLASNNSGKNNATKGNDTKQLTPETKPDTKTVDPVPTDSSENGKYLVIKEWGVKFPVPENFKGEITYVISNATDPDTGLAFQGADIYVMKDSLEANECGVTNTDLGPSTTITTTYLRTDASQPFDSSRYKGATKANILKDGTYDYHINYSVPDCIGGGDNFQEVSAIQESLVKLSKI